jgi:hypothetical protein
LLFTSIWHMFQKNAKISEEEVEEDQEEEEKAEEEEK